MVLRLGLYISEVFKTMFGPYRKILIDVALKNRYTLASSQELHQAVQPTTITKHELYTRCRVRHCRYKGDHERVFILSLPSKPIREARHTQLATHTTQTARSALINTDSNWGQWSCANLI